MQPPDRFSLLSVISFFILLSFGLSSTFLEQNTTPSANQTHITKHTDDKMTLMEIPIYTDNNGLYYVNVTWRDTHNPYKPGSYSYLEKNMSNLAKSDSTGKMLLNLYTSTSFISTCEGFIPYQCRDHDCSYDDDIPYNHQYLYSGEEIYGYQALIGFNAGPIGTCGYQVLYAFDCGTSFPQNISGFLSLGHYLNALKELSRNFSLFLSDGKDNTTSALLFGQSDKLELIDSSSNYSFTEETDSSWRIQLSSIQIQNADKSMSTYIGLWEGYATTFDLNTDAVVFPSTLYRNLTQILEGYGVKCNGANYKAYCDYTGDLNNLPSINLVTGKDTAKMLVIPPELYMKRPEVGIGYTLQFAASTKYPASHFVVNYGHENDIILGTPFLTYYYVHFEGSEDFDTHSITINKANHQPKAPLHKDQLWVYILIAVLISVIAVIAIGSYIMMKKKKGKSGKSKDKNSQSSTPERADYQYQSDLLTGKFLKKNKITPLLKAINSPPSSGRNYSLNQDVEYIEPEYVFRNNNKTSDISQSHDIQAYTYQKQNYNRLYENCNSFGQSYQGGSIGK